MKRRQLLLSGVLFSVLCLNSATGFAAPVPSGNDPGANPVTQPPTSQNTPVAGQKDVSSQEATDVVDKYWTSAKRKSAVAREVFVEPNTTESLKSIDPQIEEEIASPGTEAQARGRRDLSPRALPEPQAWGTYPFPYTRYKTSLMKNTYPEKTIGKLFFTLSGINYVCSASVISAHTLITARHCIYDYATAAWATNVVFYPGYDNGVANTNLGPSNGWAARRLYTWTSSAAGWQYDIGFIQTWNKNRTACAPTGTNQQIEYYTGTLGYKYGGSYDNRQFDAFGYPQASPFNGNFPYQCETSTGALASYSETNTLEVGCDMTGGSSGGPWLDTYRLAESGSMNYVTSLNSFKWTSPSRPLSMNGPQFMTGNFYNLYTGAVALSCP